MATVSPSEHTADSGVRWLHGTRWLKAVQSGVVVVFCEEHNDVGNVPGGTLPTARTVSYGSPSVPYVNLPLRRARSATGTPGAGYGVVR